MGSHSPVHTYGSNFPQERNDVTNFCRDIANEGGYLVCQLLVII